MQIVLTTKAKMTEVILALLGQGSVTGITSGGVEIEIKPNMKEGNKSSDGINVTRLPRSFEYSVKVPISLPDLGVKKAIVRFNYLAKEEGEFEPTRDGLKLHVE